MSPPVMEGLLGCGVTARVSFLQGSWTHPGGWHPQHVQMPEFLRALEAKRQGAQRQKQGPREGQLQTRTGSGTDSG